jgi:hypothetical protein
MTPGRWQRRLDMTTLLDLLPWLLTLGGDSANACEGTECDGDISPGVDPHG